MSPRDHRIRTGTIALVAAIATSSSPSASQVAEPSTPAPSSVPADVDGSPEAIELVRRIHEAIGGADVAGMRATMRIRRGERDEDPVLVQVCSRPARDGRPMAAVIRQSGGGRSDSELGFDGRRGWMSDGSGGFLPLAADQARSMLAGADLQALVREIPRRFDRFDLDPATEFRGRRALALRALRDADPPGSFTRLLVDPSSAMPIAIESFDADDEAPFSTAVFEDWERRGEVRVFRRMTTQRRSGPVFIEFEQIAYGALPETAFESPLVAEDAGREQEAEAKPGESEKKGARD